MDLGACYSHSSDSRKDLRPGVWRTLGSVRLRVRMAGVWAQEPYLLCFESQTPGYLSLILKKV